VSARRKPFVFRDQFGQPWVFYELSTAAASALAHSWGEARGLKLKLEMAR
jgi:hypothetical protein